MSVLKPMMPFQTCIRLSVDCESTIDDLSREMLNLIRSRPGDIHRQSIVSPVALLRNSSSMTLYLHRLSVLIIYNPHKVNLVHISILNKAKQFVFVSWTKNTR